MWSFSPEKMPKWVNLARSAQFTPFSWAKTRSRELSTWHWLPLTYEKESYRRACSSGKDEDTHYKVDGVDVKSTGQNTLIPRFWSDWEAPVKKKDWVTSSQFPFFHAALHLVEAKKIVYMARTWKLGDEVQKTLWISKFVSIRCMPDPKSIYYA